VKKIRGLQADAILRSVSDETQRVRTDTLALRHVLAVIY